MMKKYLFVCLSISIAALSSKAQNVGIGTTTPANKLQVIGDVAADSVFLGNATNNPLLQFKSNAPGKKIVLWPPAPAGEQYDGIGIDIPLMRYQVYTTTVDHAFFAATSATTSNELMRIKGNGNVGIGNSNPEFPLSFPTSYGEKISIWGDPTIGRVGFAVQPSNFQMLTDAGTDITFGYGLSGSAFENMRIKYNGNIGMGTSIPKARLHVADSSVLFSGPTTLPGSTIFDPPASGAGVRMFWYPQKGAFRAGGVDNTSWDKINIGNFSFATGFNNQAKGNNSFASGDINISSGSSALTTGQANTASGNNSFASGKLNISSGFASITSGQGNTASADYTIAMGYQNTANAIDAIAIGSQNSATSIYATAFGASNTASGFASTVMGQSNSASGSYSLAAGRGTAAKAVGSTTLGYYNENTDNPNANVEAASDRILQIGNGTFSTPSNALTVLRNGNVGIGTTNPGTHRLEVKGNSASSEVFAVDGPDQTYMALYENGIARGFIGSYFGNVNDFEIGTYGGSTGTLHMTTSGQQRLSVLNNGNIGIGLTAPTYKLHVGNANNSFRIEGPAAAASGSTALSIGGNGDIVIDKPGFVGARLTIKENGNVGIGTNTPAAALDVKGYTALGENSARIKMFKTSIFTNASDGGTISAFHSLDPSKILSVSIMIETASNTFYPEDYTRDAGYQVQFYVLANSIQIKNVPGNCFNVLAKPVKINITYEE
jgi:hypothetical protein